MITHRQPRRVGLDPPYTSIPYSVGCVASPRTRLQTHRQPEIRNANTPAAIIPAQAGILAKPQRKAGKTTPAQPPKDSRLRGNDGTKRPSEKQKSSLKTQNPV